MANINMMMRYLRLRIKENKEGNLLITSLLSDKAERLVGVEYIVDIKTRSICIYLSEFQFGALEQIEVSNMLGYHIYFHVNRIAHSLEMNYGFKFIYNTKVYHGETFVTSLDDISEQHYYLLYNVPLVKYKTVGQVVYLKHIDKCGFESVLIGHPNLEQFDDMCTIKNYTPN